MLTDPDLVPFEPPARPSFRALRRSFIEAFPRSTYEQGLTRLRTPFAEILFVCDPNLIHDVLIHRADAFRRDVMFLRVFGSVLGETSLFVTEGDDWRRQRRAAAATFRHDTVISFVPVFAAMAERQVDRWRGGSTDSPIEIAADLNRTTLEIIVETMLGGPADLDVQRFGNALFDTFEPAPWQMILALFSAPAWTPFPGSWRLKQARRHLHREIGRIIRERRVRQTCRPILWSMLRGARGTEADDAMTDDELVTELLTFIGAGLEPIAVVLTWSLWLLAKDQQAQRRVLDEVRSVAEDDTIDAAHVERLAFTQQVIQETLRLYPPASAVFRQARIATTLGGHSVKAGGHVIIPVFALHRNVRLWQNPNAFEPDRFQPDRVKAHSRFSYLPFGAGPRVCIGASYAMMEATVLLATFVRAFSFHPVPGHRPRAVARVSLRPSGGMPLFVQPR